MAPLESLLLYWLLYWDDTGLAVYSKGATFMSNFMAYPT